MYQTTSHLREYVVHEEIQSASILYTIDLHEFKYAQSPPAPQSEKNSLNTAGNSACHYCLCPWASLKCEHKAAVPSDLSVPICLSYDNFSSSKGSTYLLDLREFQLWVILVLHPNLRTKPLFKMQANCIRYGKGFDIILYHCEISCTLMHKKLWKAENSSPASQKATTTG